MSSKKKSSKLVKQEALALVTSNLQILCSLCNKGKSNWDQTDWRPNKR